VVNAAFEEGEDGDDDDDDAADDGSGDCCDSRVPDLPRPAG
jgi:hypothetical protein